jgi:HK97 gp10 family phage protein
LSNDTFKWYGAEVIAKMQEATESGLTACALKVQGQAKLLTPVDTGRLRQSISYKTNIGGDGDLETEVIEGEAIIGTNVFYAPFVEYGTSRQKPQSYLRAGLDYVKGSLPEIFKQYYDKTMK